MLSHVQLLAATWNAAPKASLSFTMSGSLLKLMSIESVMPSTISSSVAHFSSCSQSLSPSGSFPVSWPFPSGGQSVGASASVLLINQFSSVAQPCLTLCNPMNRSTPGLPVHHHLPEFTQTYVHRVRDAIQSSPPQLSPFPPALNPSQHSALLTMPKPLTV